MLSSFTLSGGINGPSSGYRSGTVCANLVESPNPITGAQSCASSAPPDRVAYSFIVPPYAIASARIGYRLSKVWGLAVNLENIFDKTSYQTAGVTVTSGNWYGAPRSAMFTLSGKW